MIEPSYLAYLRGKFRCELVLSMIQLEQLCPEWWQTTADLAEQLNANPLTLMPTIREMQRLGLIKRYSIVGPHGGLWIWWVKKSHDDQPATKREPAWNAVNVRTGLKIKIPLSRRHEWGRNQGASKTQLKRFLFGHTPTLKGEWRITSTPFDR